MSNNRRLNLNNNRAFQLLMNPGSVSRPMEIEEINQNDNQNNNNINYSNSQFYYFDNNQRVILFESEISNTKLSIGGGNKEYPLSVNNNRVFITIKRKKMYLINENSTLQLWSADFTEQYFPDVLLVFIKIPEFCLNIKKRKNEVIFEEPDSNLFSRIEVDPMSSLTRGLIRLKSSRARKPRQNERQRLNASLAASRIAEADRLAEEEEYNEMQKMFPLFKRRKTSFGLKNKLQKIKEYLVSL